MFVTGFMKGAVSQPLGMAHGGDRQNALLSKPGKEEIRKKLQPNYWRKQELYRFHNISVHLTIIY